MSDQFATIIQDGYEDNGYDNVIIQAVQLHRDWHTLPIIVICPEQKADARHAFNHVNIVNTYTCFYIIPNLGFDFVQPQIDQFVMDSINIFMADGLPQDFDDAGAWDVTVEAGRDVDPNVYEQQYTRCMVKIHVSWIKN